MKLPSKQIKWRRISLSDIYVVSLVGTMIILLMRKNEILLQTSLFSEDSLDKLQGQLMQNTSGIFFLLQRRIAAVCAFFVMAATSLGGIYVYLNALWYGIGSGLFLTIVLMRYGIKGILLLVAGMFPHYLIYIPVIILVMHICKEKRTINSRFLGQLAVLTVVVIIGCILECYVNPQVVAKILTKF